MFSGFTNPAQYSVWQWRRRRGQGLMMIWGRPRRSPRAIQLHKDLAASCLCVAVLVRPADWPAHAVLGQHLFIRIHRGVSECKWHEISRLLKTKLAMMRTYKLVVDFQQENMGTR